MINEKRARCLQKQYVITRNDRILSLLQLEAEAICLPLVNIQIKKTGAWIEGSRLIEVAHDASVRFIEMYLKHPDWVCLSFRNRLYLEVLYFLYNKSSKKRTEEIPQDMLIQDEIEQENDNYVIEDIMSDTPYWRNVLLECYRAKSYKKFILKINEFVNKRWIFDHAKRLKKLYVNTRRY